MPTSESIDWSDVEAAAKSCAGNWRKFPCFVWHRGHRLPDPDRWLIYYTSQADSGLLDQSNEHAIRHRLRPFLEGEDPDVVAELHSHWAVGSVTGFSIRVYRPDRTVTPEFQEFCRIKHDLASYLILDETD
jgi:hypothetical protein